MSKAKLSPPWITYYRELNALFENDKEVNVSYDDDNSVVNISVSNYEKANALKAIIPKKMVYGNVTLYINIEYNEKQMSLEEIYKTAFKDNPCFKSTFVFQTDTNPITYVVFEKKVVQYWNDDLSDPHGVTSTLYEAIARNVLVDNGAVYSTDSEKIKTKAEESSYNKLFNPSFKNTIQNAFTETYEKLKERLKQS